MRTTMTWLVLALACCGIALAANGTGTQDPGIYIPPLDDGRNGSHAGNWESGDLWQMARQASRVKAWEAKRDSDELAAREPVKNNVIAVLKETPASADDSAPAGDSDSLWLPDLAKSWPVALIVEAVLFAFLLPVVLVGLSISMRRARRRRQIEDHVIRVPRSRPAVQPILAAHLVRTQLATNESAEVARDQATRQTRRAA